jgi:hypothetical protein
MVKKIVGIFTIITGLSVPCIESQEMNAFRQGISLGYDFSGLITRIFQPSQFGSEISLTAGSFKRFYYTVEAGLHKITDHDTLFNYFSNGQYARIGFDYNFYKKKKPDENNMVFLGLRLGMASLNHSANNIIIKDSKWGNYSAPAVPETNVMAQWVEIAAGIRVEILKNLSMGWSGRLRFLLHLKGNEKPFIIPGFGSGYTNTTLGFNYSIYYTFPLRKY